MRTIPSLIFVTNRRQARLPFTELVVRALAGGVGVVQLREKDLSDHELGTMISSLFALGIEPAQLMVNGRPKLAQEFDIGLHFPEVQSDTARDPRFNRLTSRAVHTPEGAAAAKDCDFQIAGHVFATSSKPGLPSLGLPGLRAIVHQSPRPVFAIGGITPETVIDVVSAGASGIAVMSQINESLAPEQTAAAFRGALELCR